MEIFAVAGVLTLIIGTKLFSYAFGRMLKWQRRKSLHRDSKGYWVWEGTNGIVYRSLHHPDSPEGNWGENLSTSVKFYRPDPHKKHYMYMNGSFGDFGGDDSSD